MTMPTDQAPYFGEEAADAVQEQGPAGLLAHPRPRHSRTLGGGDAESYFPARTREEAETSLEAIRDYCRVCPERYTCPEDECAVYRAEKAAIARRTAGDGERGES